MHKSTIDPKEIGVIVRGLIVGNDQADEKKKFTKRSLASVRKYLSGAQILFIVMGRKRCLRIGLRRPGLVRIAGKNLFDPPGWRVRGQRPQIIRLSLARTV